MLHVLNEETTFSCDYAEIIDEDEFIPATNSTLHARAIVAGWINGIRLIDNISMKWGARS
jgi:pantoate--beta-alanine ligase